MDEKAQKNNEKYVKIVFLDWDSYRMGGIPGAYVLLMKRP